MRPVRVYGRTADCGPVVYPDCGDCGGRDEMILVCSSYVSVLCLSVFVLRRKPNINETSV